MVFLILFSVNVFSIHVGRSTLNIFVTLNFALLERFKIRSLLLVCLKNIFKATALREIRTQTVTKAFSIFKSYYICRNNFIFDIQQKLKYFAKE